MTHTIPVVDHIEVKQRHRKIYIKTNILLRKEIKFQGKVTKERNLVRLIKEP